MSDARELRIQDAPHGINLVVETGGAVYIGRFDETNGFEVLMHDCDVHPVRAGEDTEEYIRNTARYGIAVNEKTVTFDALAIRRVRLLGDIPKE